MAIPGTAPHSLDTPSFTRTLVVLLTTGLLQACSSQPAEEPDWLSELEGGEGERCVQLSRIASTRVLNDRAIEFQMRGGATYINILPNRCPGLRPNQPFMYKTSLNQLCDLDLIRVLDNSLGYRPLGSCGLGKFHLLIGGGPAILEDQD